MSHNSLLRLRRQIDSIDARIIKLIGRRLCVAKTIGELKASRGLSATDVRRERQLKNIYRRLARRYKIPVKTAMKVLKELLEQSKRTQKFL